jgi:hypothetical protein
MSGAQNALRFDLYGPIHKALRRGMCGLLVRFSSTDFTDEQQRTGLLRDLRLTLSLMAHHLKSEDAFFHPALEEKAQGAAARPIQDHVAHSRTAEEVTRLANTLESADAAGRQAAAMKLYHRYSEFVGENLVHMAEEEHVLQPLFHQHYTDEELLGLTGKVRANLSPEVNMAFLGFMIPALNREERARLLGGLKASVPPQAFNAVMQTAARPSLTPEDWQHLTHQLGLPA